MPSNQCVTSLARGTLEGVEAQAEFGEVFAQAVGVVGGGFLLPGGGEEGAPGVAEGFCPAAGGDGEGELDAVEPKGMPWRRRSPTPRCGSA